MGKNEAVFFNSPKLFVFFPERNEGNVGSHGLFNIGYTLRDQLTSLAGWKIPDLFAWYIPF